MTERKVYRMCETRELAGQGRVRATHVTTRKQAEVDWDDRLSVEDNHAAAAALVLGRPPEFQSAMYHGGFMFGVDPAGG